MGFVTRLLYICDDGEAANHAIRAVADCFWPIDLEESEQFSSGCRFGVDMVVAALEGNRDGLVDLRNSVRIQTRMLIDDIPEDIDSSAPLPSSAMLALTFLAVLEDMLDRAIRRHRLPTADEVAAEEDRVLSAEVFDTVPCD